MVRHFLLLLIAFQLSLVACSQNKEVKASGKDQNKEAATERKGLASATFAGGCFWCIEYAFESLKGVKEVEAGYSGGKESNPTYQQVSSGQTGHAEVIRVWYDPVQISYAKLLEAFFAAHDPTTLNRQGPDVGPQYRSAIFYRSAQEREQAERLIQNLNVSGRFRAPIVTQVVAFDRFWPAEDYHQDYYRQNPDDPYIRSVSRPKVEKFRKEMGDQLKDKK